MNKIIKNHFILLTVLIILFSCKNDSKKKVSGIKANELEISDDKVEVLDHPLIFEELDIKILEFSSEEVLSDTFMLTISIENKENSIFKSGHFFFIHAFEYIGGDALGMDTKDGILEGNRIVFKRLISTSNYDFEEFRFGLVDRAKKERYFVRTLTNVAIKQ